MQQQTLQPVAVQERIQAIDIIRGFALFGILVINFTVDDGDVSPMEGRTGLGDQLVWWMVRLFMDDRFQTIYCLLFGLGFAIQMQRAADRNSPFFFVFLRRMIALYIIGIALFIFSGKAYYVLPMYAMVGVLLLAFRTIPVKFLPVFAILFLITAWTRDTVVKFKIDSRKVSLLKQSIKVDSTILKSYTGVFQDPKKQKFIILRKGDTLYGEGPARRFMLTPLSDSHFIRKDNSAVLTFKKDSTGFIHLLSLQTPTGITVNFIRIKTDIDQALKKQLQQRGGAKSDSTSSYKQFIERNAATAWERLKNWSWKNFFWRQNLPTIGYALVLFLLGAYIGRRKMLHDVAANRNLLSTLFKWSIIAGGLCIAFYIGFQAWNYINRIKWEAYSFLIRTLLEYFWTVGTILMALGYIAGVALLTENINWKKRFFIFSTVGRLGLTNYILTITAGFFIFSKFDFCLGLYGKIGPLYRVLIALTVFVLLYFFSAWWLKYFRMGPFEWLWRSLTYLKFQPIRLLETVKKGDDKI